MLALPLQIAMTGDGSPRQTPLQDIADLPLQCLGSCQCNVSLGGLATEQDVYFIPSAKSLFLLLSMCKEPWFMPASFPHQPQVAVQALAAAELGQPPVGPTAIPVAPHKGHVRRLKEWLLQHFSASTFNTTRNLLPVMEDDPHHIQLAPNAIPHACHIPASVPKHWEDEVKAQLEDIRRGIIKPGSTQCCTSMVVVAEKSGQPRCTVNYQCLNAMC